MLQFQQLHAWFYTNPCTIMASSDKLCTNHTNYTQINHNGMYFVYSVLRTMKLIQLLYSIRWNTITGSEETTENTIVKNGEVTRQIIIIVGASLSELPPHHLTTPQSSMCISEQYAGI